MTFALKALSGAALLTCAFVYAIVVVALHITGVPDWVPDWIPLWH